MQENVHKSGASKSMPDRYNAVNLYSIILNLVYNSPFRMDVKVLRQAQDDKNFDRHCHGEAVEPSG